MDTITLYRWRARDERTGRWRTLRYLATEQDMAARFPPGEYQKIDGSHEVRRVPPRGTLARRPRAARLGQDVKCLVAMNLRALSTH